MSKIDWSKALAEYLKDETESYASIARKYGVSLQAVKKKAGREKWRDLRRKSIQEINQRLPKLTGEAVAMIDARQAQMGKMMQYIGLKAIVEKRLAPENFTQAKESIKDGAKIERQAVGAGAEARGKAELSNFFNKTRVTWDDDSSEEINKLPSIPVQKSVQTAPNTPAIDPQLLAEIQRGLSQMKKTLDEAKRKPETRKNESTSVNDQLTGWF